MTNTTLKRLACVNSCLHGVREDEIHSSALSLQNWAHGFQGGILLCAIRFLFCVHAAETTEPLWTLVRCSLHFSSISPCRKAEKNKYLTFFFNLQFSYLQQVEQHSSGQTELCIHSIQFCTPRGNKQCAPKEKYPSASTSGAHYFHANKNISLLFL